MRAFSRLAAVATMAILGLESPAMAEPAGIQQLWSGTWVMTEDTTNAMWFLCCEGPSPQLPLAPKYRKIRDEFAALPFNSPVKTTGNLPKCITPGTPGLMQHPLLFEFVWNPDRVGAVFQDGSYRRFYTDGRGFPEEITPSYHGLSIAKWEGETLVVETRGISTNAEMFLSAPLYASSRTKVTERYTVKKEKRKIRLIEAEKILHVQTTIEDSEMLTRPFTFDMEFIPVPISFDTGCAANNRDDGDSFDLTPPKDDE